eukprot:Phypoly_transcript_06551.p1 GENE.Phypoly_transcript_06551~~Phypoly_transcript_06551.p1  ORF type:complete len:461 (+),score=46.27 Phypoly_transcript_06551:319-1701(+)
MITGLHSNNVVVIRNSKSSFFVVKPNQRLHQIVMMNCVDCKLWVLDSAVIVTQTTLVFDCDSCLFLFEDVDMRVIEFHGTRNSEIVLIDSLPLVEYTRVYWRQGCMKNKFTLGAIIPGMVFGMSYKPTKTIVIPDIAEDEKVSHVDGFKNVHTKKYPKKTAISALPSRQDHLERIQKWAETKLTLSMDEILQAYDDERQEYEEPQKDLEAKVDELIKILGKRPNHVVCYTGAGISTSAEIPDYRGPQGVWTLRDKGQQSDKSLEFGDVRPTYAHYAITELVRRKAIHFVISTNMDALHLRSGLPPHLIVEQHGNCNKEICEYCQMVYYRKYDTHEGYPDHRTGRKCTFCNNNLMDTIVNFAENLHEVDQMNSLWHARKSTVALVMGTSMNVQPAASYPLQCLNNGGALVIVNLQRTPFDELARIRIFAKTDNFMQVLISKLGIKKLDTSTDSKEQWSDES